MRILLTGATGFVGQHVASLLGGHEVFATTRGRHQSQTQTSNIEWIPGNLSEGLDTAKLPARMDAIIHLAQSDRYRDFPAGAPDVFQVNVAVPAQLLAWAKTAGVSRAVFASTGTVYEPFTGPMHEAAMVAPTGYYGASKLACETLTAPYQSADLAVAQMRIFFVYGPGQAGSMITRIMDSVRGGQPVTLPKTGDGLVFAPTYVADTARVLVQACVEGWRGPWNLASPHAISMADFVTAIGAAAGRTPIVTRTDQAPPTPIVPDLTKLQTKVDVAAFVTPAEGAKRTLLAA
jgi:UDP-glucose 4-epimerase